jgi:hypothetical protein
MNIIQEVQDKIINNEFEFSEHAVTQTITRNMSVQEIREAINSGAIIADYPNDKYGPSVLLFGLTQAQRPLHVQCTYPSRPLINIITTYQPDEQRWIDYRTRRRP